jgi:hypothetical protein
MNAELQTNAIVAGEIVANGVIVGIVDSETILGDVDAGPIEIVRTALPYYTGQYEATPSPGEQVFSTAEKSMSYDFVVHAIPYEEVDNAAGGKTVTIAGIE